MRGGAVHRHVLCAVVGCGLMLAGCSMGAEEKPRGAEDRSASGSPAPRHGDTEVSPGASASPGDYPFAPASEHLPSSAADGLRLARTVAAEPEVWGQGFVAASPHESDPARWARLGEDCVWQREPLPDSVLTSLTRHSELPAEDGKGPLRVSAVVTVHRDAEGADWEMAGTLEEALRCPGQRLRDDERIEGLLSQGQAFGTSVNRYAEDTLRETGTYHSDQLGGPHLYVWSQARIGQTTVAVAAKGADGRTQEEIDTAVRNGLTTMLNRIEEELGATR